MSTFQLYSESLQEAPIAWFQRSKPGVSRAHIALMPDAEIIRDEVVVSALVLQRDIRIAYARYSASAGFGSSL
jgi:hypothetical protein